MHLNASERADAQRETSGDDLELRNACFETVKDLRRRPLLTTLALDGVAYNAERKKLFHGEARRALTALADAA